MKSRTIKQTNIFLIKTISIILSFTIILAITSCKKIETIDNPIAVVYLNGIPHIINDEGKTLSLNEYDKISDYFDSYLGVRKNNKWGFIKNTGEPITKIEYDRVGRMAENKAVVVKDGTSYIIDNTGETLYTFENGITSYSYFSENKLIIEKDGLLGYLTYNQNNSTFSILINPTYQYAEKFQEGFGVVGKLVENKMKYNYLNEHGQLLISDFIFDEASFFCDGLAKVGFLNTSMKYQYLKPNLTESNEPIYLTNTSTNEVISYEYASDFSSGFAFVANYHRYSAGNTEDTEYYRWYSIVDIYGNFNYENELSFVMKKVPKNFFPHSPLYIDNVLVFLNGYRSSNIWEFYRHTKYQQPDENDVFYEVTDFEKITFKIDQDQEIVKQVINENDWTFELTKSNLSRPYEVSNFKYNETLKCYIATSKISSDKMGIIKIISTPIPEDKGNSLDTHQFNIEYVVAPIYDNIIY